jgi:negative regulator of sigma E activity
MMEGDKQARQWISALMDSELAHLTATQIDALYHSEDQKNTWSIYHQIGDLLRFEHQALSHDFQVKLSTQLDLQSEHTLPKQKYAELTSLVSKKIYFLVAMLVMIVVVPSTVLIVKSSLSLFDKKAREDVHNNVPSNVPNHAPNYAPNNTPATKVDYQHIPVHLAQ